MLLAFGNPTNSYSKFHVRISESIFKQAVLAWTVIGPLDVQELLVILETIEYQTNENM